VRYDILRQAAIQCSEDNRFDMDLWSTCLGGKILDNHHPEWKQLPTEEYFPLLKELLEVKDPVQSYLLRLLISCETDVKREGIISVVEEYIVLFQAAVRRFKKLR
jgi:hypothetical protein